MPSAEGDEAATPVPTADAVVQVRVQHVAPESNEGSEPPTRRVLVFVLLCFAGMALFIAGIAGTLSKPSNDNSSIVYTFWMRCTNVGGSYKNCSNLHNDASVVAACPASSNVVHVTQWFGVGAVVFSMIAGAVAASSFLGSACAAKNLTFLTCIFSLATAALATISFACAISFTTRQRCDGAAGTALADAGYSVGDCVPLFVTGCAVMLAACATAVVPWGALDYFVETDCCSR